MDASVPPPLPTAFRSFLAGLLGLCLLFFLAEGVLDFLSQIVQIAGGRPFLAFPQSAISLLSNLAALVVYTLIGFTAAIPRRVFLPVTLFSTLAFLAFLPFAIYFPQWNHQGMAFLALVQVGLGLGAWRVVRGSFGWPMVPLERLPERGFSGWFLFLFSAANLLFLPLLAGYLALCAAMAVDHFSAHFVGLRTAGIEFRTKTYARGGKTVELIPMIHLGSPAFYREALAAIPPEAQILREGVSDEQHLLRERLDYDRVARLLGLVGQKEAFQTPPERTRRADLDVADFTPETRTFINTISAFWAKGQDPQAALDLQQAREKNPNIVRDVFDEIIGKRNAHLLSETDAELATTGSVALPWGAGHMPGLEAGLEKEGFRLTATRDLPVVTWRELFRHLAEGISASLPSNGVSP